MLRYETLGQLLDGGFTITAHCFALDCRHKAVLDLAGLAERLGRDFVAIGDPNPLVKLLRCQRCGQKDIGLIVSPKTGYTNGPPSHGQEYAKIDPSLRPTVTTRRARRKVKL
jgi:hypothetical protein